MAKFKEKTIGFGYNPLESNHYFIIEIPKKISENVNIYECVSNDNGEEKTLKIVIPKKVWLKVAPFLEREFNNLLSSYSLKKSKFSVGDNIIERLLGKELCLLLFSIEHLDNNSDDISQAIHNWSAIEREFRWFLYTMVDTSAGEYSDSNIYKGWREAIKIALSDRPGANREITRQEVIK